LDRPQRPFFCPGVRGIDEGFGEINFAAVAEILREALQEPVKPAGPLPLLEAPMARLVRRIAGGQIVPRGPRAEHPEHAVHHRPRVGPRPAAFLGTGPRPERRFEDRPLGVS